MYGSFPWIFSKPRSGAIKANNNVEIWFSEGSSTLLFSFACILSTCIHVIRGRNWIIANPATSRHVPTCTWFLLAYDLVANNGIKIRNTLCRIEEAERNETRATPPVMRTLFIFYACAVQIVHSIWDRNIYSSGRNVLLIFEKYCKMFLLFCVLVFLYFVRFFKYFSLYSCLS